MVKKACWNFAGRMVKKTERLKPEEEDPAVQLGSFKIHIDGCVKDGFASVGGIIRDLLGRCIRTFFSSYGECYILEAEPRAILDEVEDLGLFRLLFATSNISLFSTVTLFLIFIARATRCLTYLLQRDWKRRCYFEYSAQNLPRHYSLVQADRHGLPTVRSI
ncbi:Uncharacterized protein Adt_13742 [Abeliophyllum distichum]|uniref:RNase H type-1 domain-containing protein n=1 Tax=Abeliophyllum distichum TaxID=126358 RepID=A0ABD1TXN8_9LAMI